MRNRRAVATGALSTLYSTERGHLRIYDRSPPEDQLRAGVVSSVYVRLQHARLFPAQSLHLSSEGHVALLLGHPTLYSTFAQHPVDQAAAIVSQIADGASALHAERILHLDIHIQNVSTMTIMVGAATSVALFDSEHARHLDLPSPPGDFGAPRRAPELASGRADVRSDIFGLGVLLHQLLFGARMIARPTGDSPVERLLSRMLARDPEQRPSTTADVRDELAKLGPTIEASAPRKRFADARARVIVLAPEPQEIARAFGTSDNTPVESRWIADTCELGLRDGKVFVTERPLGGDTSGSSDDPSEPLVVGDVIRIGALAFAMTTGEPDLLDERPRHASTTERACTVCGRTAPAWYSFCLYCGASLLEGSPVTVPPPPLPAALPLPPPPPPPPPPPVVPTTIPPRRTEDVRAIEHLELVPGRIAPGEQVGYWTVHELIALGGFGEVYRAEHRSTGRRVAIKALVPQLLAYPFAVERFLGEARVLHRVRHPHVIQLLYVARTIERPFLVLELLDGMTLAEWMRRGRSDYRFIWSLASQLAGALATIHGLGEIHRDLQPNNIFVVVAGERPSCKLVDFGASFDPHANEPDDPEREPVLVGAPAYMAPEYIRGAATGPPIDIFGLGVVLYELASGDNPFRADDMGSMLMRILQEDPPKLRRRGDLPRGFRKLVSSLLAKDPMQRPTAVQLVARLAELAPHGSS